MEGDNEKFLIFANFIADAYEEAGEVRCARIIRKKIHGSIVEVVSAGKIFNAGTTKLCLMEGKRYGIKNNKGVYSMQYAW